MPTFFISMSWTDQGIRAIKEARQRIGWPADRERHHHRDRARWISQCRPGAIGPEDRECPLPDAENLGGIVTWALPETDQTPMPKRGAMSFRAPPRFPLASTCHGSSDINFRYSASGQALRVRVRTFPRELSARTNLATSSPFGASTMARRSESPDVI